MEVVSHKADPTIAGITCPECGGTEVRVTDSRPCKVMNKGSVRRRRGCDTCDHRWATFEVTELTLKSLRHDIKKEFIKTAFDIFMRED